jgi:hypothetical protein
MRAVVRDEYRGPDVLKIEEIDGPDNPAEGARRRVSEPAFSSPAARAVS